MSEVKITEAPNGPFMVEGPITLIGADGAEIEVTTPVVYLCRCGGSARKPFCDTTHRKIGGFGPAETARVDAEQAANG